MRYLLKNALPVLIPKFNELAQMTFAGAMAELCQFQNLMVKARILQCQMFLERELERSLSQYDVIMPQTQRILHPLEGTKDLVWNRISNGLGQFQRVTKQFSLH